MVCGLKITHDGAVAVIRDGRLVCSVEAEKIGNRARYSELRDLAEIQAQLRRHDVEPESLSGIAVDGWARAADGENYVWLRDGDRRVPLDVAGYDDPVTADHRSPAAVHGAAVAGLGAYTSYSHAMGHVFAAYSTSPAAARGASSLVMVWDGGMAPFLYHVDPARGAVRGVGRTIDVSGGLYPIFASHFEPFRVDRRSNDPNRAFGMEALLPVSGKAMAYAGLGKPVEAVIDAMYAASAEIPMVDTPMQSYRWSHRTLELAAPAGATDAELLASFQEFLFRRLLAGLGAVLERHPELRGEPICLSGGCALNIKWNSGLRASGLFAEVWVPPFPNDAGSAIGAACAEMARLTGRTALDWSEFAGPELGPAGPVPAGWTATDCTAEELGALLHAEPEPVVLLSGRAELGPRALGHRSIIAPATSAAMKDRLNDIKGREWYRPVAPVCLVERAAEVFDPGGADPFMLFDHDVRPGWLERIPAVVHLDGSARLQTVSTGNQPLHTILSSYARSSGIPVLCNTSANLSGRGFFPDAASAMEWGGVGRVWADGVLYRRD